MYTSLGRSSSAVVAKKKKKKKSSILRQLHLFVDAFQMLIEVQRQVR
jgi:hypothetical protein